MSDTSTHAQIVVLGGGPGGYPAAFLAADLGLSVTLVEMETNPGGVCLYRGCIPSKALLHVSRLLNESKEASEWGVSFGPPRIDLDKMRAWKDQVIKKLTGGLGVLTKQRKIRHLKGRGRFTGPNAMIVTHEDGKTTSLTFDHAILSTGSRPVVPANLKVDSPRVVDSTGALALTEIPPTMLVIGGGYIGCELGSVYAALGTKVTVVEMSPHLVPGADRDLAGPLVRRLEKIFHQTLLKTRVVEMKDNGKQVEVRFEGLDLKEPVQRFDKVLVSVGRRPNSEDLGLEHTRVKVNAKGFVEVDSQRRTAEPTIFAVGDVAGEPMLAHKASHEGRIAIETIMGKASVFEPKAIPAVVFTDPELAWCGITENEAKQQGIQHRVVSFPWQASGRATTLDRNDGLTKLIVDPHTEQVLGVGICGVGAGEMIAEGVLAVEMAARVSDLKMTIHAHPTLSETMMEASEIFFGHATHVLHKK